MITEQVQRWRDGHSCPRPAGEPIDPSRWEVAAIADDTTAKAFVKAHHYSGSYPAARCRFGIYSRSSALSGVAVFSVPPQGKVLEVVPGEPEGKGELGRLVLLDEVPANGESWFIARCFELLQREGWTGVVSFADPMPRRSGAGVVSPGHVGTIYQATNGVYLGRSAARTLRMFADGSVLNARSAQKVRSRAKGWRSVVGQLVAHGARPLEDGEDSSAWLARWRPRVTRAVRHPGNFKYAWAFSRRDRRHLPDSLPYPKVTQ